MEAFKDFDFISLTIFGSIATIFIIFKYVFKKKLSPILLILISAVLGVSLCLIFL